MFLRLRGVRIHFKILGAADQTIVFFPGWGADITHYTALLKHLAQNFKVLAIDLPGFGLSTTPPEVWGTPEYAALIAELLNTLSIQNPILLGHSFGGKLALYLTAKKMVIPDKLILIGSNGVKLPKSLVQHAKIYAYKLLKHLAHLPVMRLIFASQLDKYRNKIGSVDYKNAHGIMRTILVKTVNEDFSKLLPLIDVSTLLIWGANDQSAPLAIGTIMHAQIHNSQLIVLANAGHFPHLDKFTEVVAGLSVFLH